MTKILKKYQKAENLTVLKSNKPIKFYRLKKEKNYIFIHFFHHVSF